MVAASVVKPENVLIIKNSGIISYYDGINKGRDRELVKIFVIYLVIQVLFACLDLNPFV